MYKIKIIPINSNLSMFIETFSDLSGCLIIREIIVVIFYGEEFRILGVTDFEVAMASIGFCHLRPDPT